ncbi:hypothetical protein EMIHUDRAFT_198338 [Emiliania huxleyi CCMP1516]|uniref:AP2/ERF domain-containing protein n=2 Tax=Emiliania huxleyi TaxID=2903 RepID=A0A0D3I737_EMIH1|nr:hypothetical protein EMIHUDRAFT_198338 [Emiliania huxleyi CCMP1516]EOD07072.1 hypothetical protein EMIHUDRAFT_198338 [Emiliania huxleyi CCMP1516]|eukprot:XP_005759501.1 hypothetical protein EMIHUDRAFT_198338 [Emiliania huxleyi CCMP1516]
MLKPQPSVKLIRSNTGAGYKCVRYAPIKGSERCYVVYVDRAGAKTCLGRFATPEEAAYCYATSPEGLKDAAKIAKAEAPEMTSAEATATATEEELELHTNGSGFVGVFQTPPAFRLPWVVKVRRGHKVVSLGYFASSGTRFLGVHAMPAGRRLPFRASYSRDGLEISLGYFATAEEAALCRARELAAQADAPPAADDELTATCPICIEPIEADSAPMLEEHASVEAERAARAEATARSDEQQAAFVYHSGVPRPVDLARCGYRPLFSQRRGGHMARGEAHPRAARPVRPDPPGDNYDVVEAAQRRLDARRRLDADAAKKQKKE